MNISEIKCNSLFGTRAICSNIFQRMSRRYILKITLEYKWKCRINSNVVIKKVPNNTAARWIKTNNTATLVLLWPLVTLRRSDPILHRKHSDTSKFLINIFSFKYSIRMGECVTVIPMQMISKVSQSCQYPQENSSVGQWNHTLPYII